MIEENTLLRWAAELVAFANSERGPREYYTAMYEADFVVGGPEDMADHYAHKVPDEERTQDQIADTHKLAFRNLKALSECKRSALPDALLREAKQWLASPAVRSSNKANTFTPMDAVFSLDANGAIQMTPRMRNEEAQFAPDLRRADSEGVAGADQALRYLRKVFCLENWQGCWCRATA